MIDSYGFHSTETKVKRDRTQHAGVREANFHLTRLENNGISENFEQNVMFNKANQKPSQGNKPEPVKTRF